MNGAITNVRDKIDIYDYISGLGDSENTDDEIDGLLELYRTSQPNTPPANNSFLDRNVTAGIESWKSSWNYFGGAFYDLIGDEKKAKDMIDKAQTKEELAQIWRASAGVKDWETLTEEGSPLDWVKYFAGTAIEISPHIAATLATAGAGAGVGFAGRGVKRLALKNAKDIAKDKYVRNMAGLGAFAQEYGTMAGETYGFSGNAEAALAFGAPQAALNIASPLFMTYALANLSKGVARNEARNFFKDTAKKVAQSSATEGITESLQNELTLLAKKLEDSDFEWGGEQANMMRIQSAVTGSVIGGAFGTPGAITSSAIGRFNDIKAEAIKEVDDEQLKEFQAKVDQGAQSVDISAEDAEKKVASILAGFEKPDLDGDPGIRSMFDDPESISRDNEGQGFVPSLDKDAEKAKNVNWAWRPDAYSDIKKVQDEPLKAAEGNLDLEADRDLRRKAAVRTRLNAQKETLNKKLKAKNSMFSGIDGFSQEEVDSLYGEQYENQEKLFNAETDPPIVDFRLNLMLQKLSKAGMEYPPEEVAALRKAFISQEQADQSSVTNAKDFDTLFTAMNKVLVDFRKQALDQDDDSDYVTIQQLLELAERDPRTAAILNKTISDMNIDRTQDKIKLNKIRSAEGVIGSPLDVTPGYKRETKKRHEMLKVATDVKEAETVLRDEAIIQAQEAQPKAKTFGEWVSDFISTRKRSGQNKSATLKTARNKMAVIGALVAQANDFLANQDRPRLTEQQEETFRTTRLKKYNLELTDKEQKILKDQIFKSVGETFSSPDGSAALADLQSVDGYEELISALANGNEARIEPLLTKFFSAIKDKEKEIGAPILANIGGLRAAGMGNAIMPDVTEFTETPSILYGKATSPTRLSAGRNKKFDPDIPSESFYWMDKPRTTLIKGVEQDPTREQVLDTLLKDLAESLPEGNGTRIAILRYFLQDPNFTAEQDNVVKSVRSSLDARLELVQMDEFRRGPRGGKEKRPWAYRLNDPNTSTIDTSAAQLIKNAGEGFYIKGKLVNRTNEQKALELILNLIPDKDGKFDSDAIPVNKWKEENLKAWQALQTGILVKTPIIGTSDTKYVLLNLNSLMIDGVKSLRQNTDMAAQVGVVNPERPRNLTDEQYNFQGLMFSLSTLINAGVEFAPAKPGWHPSLNNQLNLFASRKANVDGKINVSAQTLFNVNKDRNFLDKVSVREGEFVDGSTGEAFPVPAVNNTPPSGQRFGSAIDARLQMGELKIDLQEDFRVPVRDKNYNIVTQQNTRREGKNADGSPRFVPYGQKTPVFETDDKKFDAYLKRLVDYASKLADPDSGQTILKKNVPSAQLKEFYKADGNKAGSFVRRKNIDKTREKAVFLPSKRWLDEYETPVFEILGRDEKLRQAVIADLTKARIAQDKMFGLASESGVDGVDPFDPNPDTRLVTEGGTKPRVTDSEVRDMSRVSEKGMLTRLTSKQKIADTFSGFVTHLGFPVKTNKAGNVKVLTKKPGFLMEAAAKLMSGLNFKDHNILIVDEFGVQKLLESTFINTDKKGTLRNALQDILKDKDRLGFKGRSIPHSIGGTDYGIVFINQDINTEVKPAFALAHEIAHQYFYKYIRTLNDSDKLRLRDIFLKDSSREYYINQAAPDVEWSQDPETGLLRGLNREQQAMAIEEWFADRTAARSMEFFAKGKPNRQISRRESNLSGDSFLDNLINKIANILNGIYENYLKNFSNVKFKPGQKNRPMHENQQFNLFLRSVTDRHPNFKNLQKIQTDAAIRNMIDNLTPFSVEAAKPKNKWAFMQSLNSFRKNGVMKLLNKVVSSGYHTLSELGPEGNKIARMLFTRRGDNPDENGGLTGRFGYINRLDLQRKRMFSALDKAMGVKTAAEQTNLLNAFFVWREAGSDMNTVPLKDRQKYNNLTKVWNENFTQYLRDSNIPATNEPDFFLENWVSHSIDVEKLEFQENREALAQVLMRKGGFSPEEATTAIAQYHANLKVKELQGVAFDGNVDAQALHKRSWDFLTYADLMQAGVAHQPVLGVTKYIESVTRAVEMNRAFGNFVTKPNPKFNEGPSRARQQEAVSESEYFPNNEGVPRTITEWQSDARLKDAIEDLPFEHRETAQYIVDGILGRLTNKTTPGFQTAMNWAMTIAAMATLPLALIPSLVDTVMSTVRTGEFSKFGSNIRYIVQGMAEKVNELSANIGGLDTPAREMKELASDVGTIVTHGINDAMQNVYTSSYMSGTAKKVSDKFFQLSGLEGITRFSRIVATSMGRDFVIKHARRAQMQPANKMSGHSRRLLNEVGITDPAAVNRWLDEGRNFDTPDGQIVADGIYNFVEQAQLKPNATERPGLANDPRFQIFYQLKSFYYSAGQKVLGGLERERKSRIGEGQNQFDAMAPMFTAAIAVLPLTAVLMALREEIKYEEEEEPSNQQNWAEYLISIVGASGALGPFEIARSIVNAQDFGVPSSIAGLGPVPGLAYGVFTKTGTSGLEELIPVYNQFN